MSSKFLRYSLTNRDCMHFFFLFLFSSKKKTLWSRILGCAWCPFCVCSTNTYFPFVFGYLSCGRYIEDETGDTIITITMQKIPKTDNKCECVCACVNWVKMFLNKHFAFSVAKEQTHTHTKISDHHQGSVPNGNVKKLWEFYWGKKDLWAIFIGHFHEDMGKGTKTAFCGSKMIILVQY